MSGSDAILNSWKANAANWIAAVNNAEIESRNLVTNEAIISTILKYEPATIFDIGCGEGWLSREFRSRGIDAFGVDAIEELVNAAIKKDGDHYKVASFQQLANGDAGIDKKFDAGVINFSLIDKEDTEALIKSVKNYLNDQGHLFIQTLHPLTVAVNDDYTTGWKDGSWNGMKRNFEQPYQWYFRTLESWMELFSDADLQLEELKEPLHPVTKKPASVIFVLRHPYSDRGRDER